MDKSLTKMSVVTPAAPELQVNTFLDDLLNLEAIEVGFNCFLTHRPDLNKANEEQQCEEFIKLLQSLQAENPSYVEVAVRYFVSQAATVSNPKKLDQLYGFLYTAVGRPGSSVSPSSTVTSSATATPPTGSRASAWSGRWWAGWTTRG